MNGNHTLKKLFGVTETMFYTDNNTTYSFI